MDELIGVIIVLFALYISVSWMVLPLTLHSIEKTLKEIKEAMTK